MIDKKSGIMLTRGENRVYLLCVLLTGRNSRHFFLKENVTVRKGYGHEEETVIKESIAY